MVIKYNIDMPNEAINKTIQKFTNQIFKLLPSREEGGNWRIPLENLICDIAGMGSLLEDADQNIIFNILCKLEYMLSLDKEEDFVNFRRLIFECLTLFNELQKILIKEV